MSQIAQEESTMTIHSQVSAFGALLLLQSEIEVNRPRGTGDVYACFDFQVHRPALVSNDDAHVVSYTSSSFAII